MENPDNKSSWDDLAQELGAATPPEPAPAPPAPAPPRPKPDKPAAKERPKSTGNEWDSLASDLGLEPPPPPRKAPRKSEPKAAAKPVPQEAEQAEAPAKPARASKPRTPKERPPRERKRAPRKAAPSEPPPAPVAQSESEPAPEPAPEAAPAAGGVSLWHKIFGAPDVQAERVAEISRASESSPPGGDQPRPAERFATPADTGPSLDSPDEMSSATAPASDRTSDSQESRPSEEGEVKRRRGRRRGRGRGRKSEGSSSTEEGASDGAESKTEAKEGRPRRRRSSRGDREQRAPADPMESDVEFDDDLELLDTDQDDTDQDDEGDDEAGESRGSAPTRHRSIPSWDEAIGMIVEVNLATRTERRRSSPQSSGRGGSGRPRGGRGRRRKKE